MSKLDDILEGLSINSVKLEKMVAKPISIRLPVLYLAQIDTLAGMKDVSRNVLLNDIIEASLQELMVKLQNSNPEVAGKLNARARELAKAMLTEHKQPHPPKHKEEENDS